MVFWFLFYSIFTLFSNFPYFYFSDKKKRLKIEESEKNALRCGLCEAKIPGGPDLLYSHSRICLMKKISTIVCPCCPQRFFETKNSYAKHLGTIQKESHKPLSHATKCVFCGHNLPTWCDLLKHQGSCFPTLNLKSFNQCSYCDMGFFFAQLENVFYFAHMNKDHSDKVLDKWIEKCNNCNFRWVKDSCFLYNSYWLKNKWHKLEGKCPNVFHWKKIVVALSANLHSQSVPFSLLLGRSEKKLNRKKGCYKVENV